MQDLERVKRDFYQQMGDWLRINERISLSSVTFISLFIATVAVLCASYFAFSNNNLSRQNVALLANNSQLQQQVDSQTYQQNSALTELKFKLKSAINREDELKKEQRKLNTEINQTKSKITTLNTLTTKLTADKLALEQKLQLSQTQVIQQKKLSDKNSLDYARLNSDYIKLNTELTERIKTESSLAKSLLIKTITPIWFEPSAYFNHQAVIALYTNQQPEKLTLFEQEVDYVYYKISGAETASGSDVFRPIAVSDKQRGLYFMVYNNSAKNWAGKEKFAFIKFKGQSKEHVISFY
ncbi:hypothetical protein [Thalassotalea agariperforans]